MAVYSQTKTYLDVAATTVENYRPQFYDQVTDAIPTIKMMKRNGAVSLDGGDGIIVELMHQFNNTVGSYSGYDLLDLTPQTPFTACKYDWADVAGSLSISQDEMDRNRGKSRMINLLQGKIKNLKTSFSNRINTMLLLDGSGNNSKDITGLSGLVQDTGTGTVGGVSGTGETWWRNVSYAYDTLVAAAELLGVGVSQGGTANSTHLAQTFNNGVDADTVFVEAIDYVFTEVSFGDTAPQMLNSSIGAWLRLKNILRTYKRFDMDDTTRADPGFRYVNFNGVPVAFDRAMSNVPLTNCSQTNTERIYFLNFDFMNFWIHENANFSTTEFHTLRPRQNAWAMNMFLKAELGVTKRNAQAVLHSLDKG